MRNLVRSATLDRTREITPWGPGFPSCQAGARFLDYRPKYWLTIAGEVTVQRAYYYCKSCQSGHCPFDQANALPGDHLSSGLRPLVCLAGTLGSFRDAADDILRRFCGANVSAGTARRATEQAGARLPEQQRQGEIAVPQRSKEWDFTIEGHSHAAAFIGLDAFSVPIQKSGGKKADYRSTRPLRIRRIRSTRTTWSILT